MSDGEKEYKDGRRHSNTVPTPGVAADPIRGKALEEAADECRALRNSEYAFLSQDRQLALAFAEKRIRSLIGTAPQKEEAWRDIASAPKDTLIWTLWDGVNNKTGEPARYHTAGCLHSGDEETSDVWLDEHGDYMDEPTHWQPVPALPAASVPTREGAE